MTRCLDEATLQTYFDGELSGAMMESATLHLAACATCAAAAREVREEIQLMTTALEAEFEASVPTERLRQRIDAAVLDQRVAVASAPGKAGFGAFVLSLLSFGTQRTLGYASLAVVLAFGAIFGLVKLKTTEQAQDRNQLVAGVPRKVDDVKAGGQGEGNLTDKNADRNAERSTNAQPESTNAQPESTNAQPGSTNVQLVTNRPAKNTPKANTTPIPAATPVKLLPGERAYLQTIARLDSTIKANQKNMRPSLQVEYERNLAVVDQAIAATRSAVKSNPNDTDAADFMFAAYQSKVDLLNTIADARVGGGRSH